MNIQSLIQDLAIYSGVSVRVDCPSCGRSNTLSITNENGTVSWNCFSASCNSRGTTSVSRSAAEIKSVFSLDNADNSAISPNFTLPPYFTSFLTSQRATNYVQSNNCLDAYSSRMVDIRLDPRMQRVVFMVKKGHKIVDAVGRALDHGAVPKWYRYGSSLYPFICGPNTITVTTKYSSEAHFYNKTNNNNIAVIVEDAASACAVAATKQYTGVALLGTTLQETFIQPLLEYDKVIIALDPDASHKAIQLHRQLSFYTRCEVRMLEDDLKYFTPDEIIYTLSDFLPCNPSF